jgi:hypothetical protein
MEIIEHFGYHTCKLKNGYDYIVENIPFRSGDGENQWLTQGFYFWTDSDYWAKKWGHVGSRVIGKFKIELCFQKEVLDLVGNVEHQVEFDAIAKRILNKLPQQQKNAMTMNQIVTKLRCHPDIFPYKGIKAQDGRCKTTFRFIDTNRAEISLITPQQLCVFEEARDRITLCGFIEPELFSKKMTV